MISELTSFAACLHQHISSGSTFDFDEVALELFGLQYRSNSPYRRICDAKAATPGNVEHWTRIPAVPAAAFKELDLTCLDPAQRTSVFYSSGTTGQKPSRHFHCSESLGLYEASLWSWFQRHVLVWTPPRLIALTPPPQAAPRSSLVHMFETVRRQPGVHLEFLGALAGDGAWTVNLDAVTQSLQRADNTGEPLVVLGTAFNFVHLIDELGARKLQYYLPPGSCAMETGGYKGRSRELSKPELHSLITERLGIPWSNIVCEYGMSELSSQAYDCVAGSNRNIDKDERAFHFPPWCRAQLISPETGSEVADGESGLIRVFDLANAFSVMAVQTEDLGVRRGNGFELIGRTVAAEPRGCSLMAI